MDSLTRQIMEVEKLLRKCYLLHDRTKTKHLSGVLPTYSALKKLKKATEDVFKLWDIYQSWCFGRHLYKHPNLMKPKSENERAKEAKP